MKCSPDCNRHALAPADKTTGTTGAGPDHTAVLIRYAVQAAEGKAHASPAADGETPGGYARRLVTAVVLHLVEQGLPLIPPDLEQRLAVQAEADDSTDHSRNLA